MMGFRLWTQSPDAPIVTDYLKTGTAGSLWPVNYVLDGLDAYDSNYPTGRHLSTNWYVYEAAGFGSINGTPKFDLSFNATQIPSGSSIGSIAWTREVPRVDSSKHRLYFPPKHVRHYYRHWTAQRTNVEDGADNFMLNPSARGTSVSMSSEFGDANPQVFGSVYTSDPRVPAPSVDVFAILGATTSGITATLGRDGDLGVSERYADGRGVHPVQVGLPAITPGGVSLRFVFRLNPLSGVARINWPIGSMCSALIDDVTVIYKSPGSYQVLAYAKE